MTTKMDYADDEWARLVRGPLVASLAISMADPGGPIEALKETAAAVRVTQAPPGDAPLLGEVATEIRDLAQRRENPLGDFRIEGAAMAGQQVLDELRAIDVILRGKAEPSEADAYRDWLLEAAQASADAAKEGGFLGFGAQQVSEGEQAMLERLRDALGMASATPPGAE
jgi:hypothetical protein